MKKKFLIGQLACFGDCLYATTIAKQIKYNYPESHITWAIASKYKAILDLNPHVDAIWEIPVLNNDFYGADWIKFEKEALKRKSNGEFDEVIFSQIVPRNWENFTGTIRKAITAAYNKPITVPVNPVIKLSDQEIKHVSDYANRNQLSKYKHVVLFECSPGSGQSIVNIDFAIEVANLLVGKQNDVCFILSSPNKLNLNNERIIDASELSYRENAELTKYCTLLIGCSSGLTWLSTSDWAKPLPTLQLLSQSFVIFAGVNFDFEVNNLDTSNIIEITDFDVHKAAACMQQILTENFASAKLAYHQSYKPDIKQLYFITEQLVVRGTKISRILKFAKRYLLFNAANNNRLSVSYIKYLAYVIKLKYNESSMPLLVALKR